MAQPPPTKRGSEVTKLSLAALGIVYGDIGTSPLYAMRECFSPTHGTAVTHDNVLGILSLFFWALTLVIVVKYLTFVLRAGNAGEGGTFALIALLDPRQLEKTRSGVVLLMLGLFGAALLCGEGIITPAVSVLGAVEGLTEAIDPAKREAFRPYVADLSVAIIVGLFVVQKRGTGRLGAVFGPLMLVWFVTIGALGARWILMRPEVLEAVNPLYAVRFFAMNRLRGFLTLGSVVLCIAGGEALYADMGHFGKAPVRLAWYAVVFPALLLNYAGQAAFVLANHGRGHPFFGLVDGWLRFPLVFIATSAAVIASQALILRTFSLARAGVQLGYFPRVAMAHTSGLREDQIYVPEINWVLALACVALVVGFGSSSKLAGVYGIAVTGTMTMTSVLFFSVARQRWRWRLAPALALVALFLTVDVSFFTATLHKLKLASGGWVPLATGALLFTVMTTWRKGRRLLAQAFVAQALPLDLFMADLAMTKPHRVRGTAVFLTSNPGGVPPVLLHHFKHNKSLHEQVLLLSIATQQVPELQPNERITELSDLGHGFYKVRAAYGFMQTPNVLELMDLCAEKGLETRDTDTSYFLGRETLLITDRRGMARWRKWLFSLLSRNARPANLFFSIPANRVVELGTQIEI